MKNHAALLLAFVWPVKGEVDFKHGRLIRKGTVQLFTESSGTDHGQAEIVPIF